MSPSMPSTTSSPLTSTILLLASRLMPLRHASSAYHANPVRLSESEKPSVRPRRRERLPPRCEGRRKVGIGSARRGCRSE